MVPISVVVPLHNEGPFLLRTLQSMATQTHGDFEAIVVNDGSTDNSEEIARGFQDCRFRVVSQPNGGPGAARNRGIAEAGGELIAFCDADDAWLPHYLQAALDAFSREPRLAAFTQGYIEYPPGRSMEAMWRRRGLHHGRQQVAGQTPLMFHYMVVYMTPPSTVIRAQALHRWGGFHEQRCKFGEDQILMLKLLLQEEVAFTLTPGVQIHRESGALSQNLKGAHPPEPFLLHPEEVEGDCPAELLPLLREFYALRAFKAACVWGYYGDWRRAAAIRDRFRVPGDYRIPWYTSSLVCSTPLGSALGAAWRLFSRVRTRTTAGPAEQRSGKP
jgi:glycosyltransferase involved in cell wall biosynthesis